MSSRVSTDKDASYFSTICTERCGGECCDPWWGIISYSVVKQGGLRDLAGFRKMLLKGLKERERRIVTAYVTKEDPPRPLFTSPERYNLVVRDIHAEGATLNIDLMAIFAFRCRFLSPERQCAIHPFVSGGRDIRPPHCGYLGLLDARPGEKGYCRIIHAAQSPSSGDDTVDRAIETERRADERNFRDGLQTAEEAADRAISRITEYCRDNLDYMLPREQERKAGRNEPCPCGSGRKFKRCHGR